MELVAYDALASTEAVGWYYQARLKAVHKLIEKFILPHKAELSILDIGCGTAGSTNSLAHYGKVLGLEPSAYALKLARERYPSLHYIQGAVNDIPNLLSGQLFDLCVILGVLYHQDVADPAEALQRVSSQQKSGNWLIWNEACFPSLMRHHDRTVQGARRFYPSQMRQMLNEAGYSIVHGACLLTWATPIAWILARLDSIMTIDSDAEHESGDHKMPNPIVNSMLQWATYQEWALSLLGIKAPIGVSYLVLAQKN